MRLLSSAIHFSNLLYSLGWFVSDTINWDFFLSFQHTMGMVSSPSELQDVGGSSGGPPRVPQAGTPYQLFSNKAQETGEVCSCWNPTKISEKLSTEEAHSHWNKYKQTTNCKEDKTFCYWKSGKNFHKLSTKEAYRNTYRETTTWKTVCYIFVALLVDCLYDYRSTYDNSG
jgi:hypothetical protein